ncbi:hypothetical protein [Streptomyces sp. LN325]|uniref:hypothetical protein n=1 Tax=Streptomyces sp. LN325 TaxID=3112976 RepID=UPI003717A2E4
MLVPGEGRILYRCCPVVRAFVGAPVEHGFAHLKTWRILTKLRTSPVRATNLLRALLVLTNLELDR